MCLAELNDGSHTGADIQYLSILIPYPKKKLAFG